MKKSAAQRISERLTQQRQEAIERKVEWRHEVMDAQKENLEEDAVLARAVFEFERKIKEASALEKKQTHRGVIGRWLGRKAVESTPRRRPLRSVRRSILEHQYRIMEPFTDRPDLESEVARGVVLPPHDVEYLEDFTFDISWSVELPWHPRPVGLTYCNIYRKTTERTSQQNEKEIMYRIHASKHPHNSPTAVYNSEVISYTDGTADDPMITLGKNAMAHATGLIQQAIEQVK